MRRLFIAIFAIVLVGVAFGFIPQAEAQSQVLIVDDDGTDCPDAGYTTIQDAVDAANNGDTIKVCTGTYTGAELNKTLYIEASGQAVINDGPNSHSFLRAGFLFPGDGNGSGSSIRGFRFEGMQQFNYTDDGHLDFPVFSREANNVTVDHNVMVNSLQAITNWHGNGWTVQHNKIEDLWTICGGGIGILLGSSAGAGAKNSVVSHNELSGTLHVAPGDCGEYSGTGIVLYADHRWGREGGEISGNTVVKNKVSLVSDTPDVVDVVAIELTDTRGQDDETLKCGGSDIKGNAVGFNDLRGTTLQLALTPTDLDECNDISRNLGDNRSQGAHPSVFGPGGN